MSYISIFGSRQSREPAKGDYLIRISGVCFLGALKVSIKTLSCMPFIPKKKVLLFKIVPIGTYHLYRS
jgi:hypothetical protein